jgi:hypothetical protein
MPIEWKEQLDIFMYHNITYLITGCNFNLKHFFSGCSVLSSYEVVIHFGPKFAQYILIRMLNRKFYQNPISQEIGYITT